MRLNGSIKSLLAGPRGIRRVAFFGAGLLLTSCASIVFLKWRNSQIPENHTAFNITHERTLPPRDESRHAGVVSPALRETLANALARAEDIQDVKVRKMAMAVAFETWSLKDFEGALSWLEKSHPPGPDFNTTECLIEALLKIDPILALDRLDNSENPAIWDSLKTNFMLRLAETNPKPVVLELLIVGRENWTVRPTVGDTVIDQWFRQSPEDAVKLIESLPKGPEQDQAKLAATIAWSGLSPAKTATWVANFPEGPVKDTALQRVTQAWVAQDLSASFKWMTGLQASRSRDVVIATLCTQLSDIYPAELFQWAKQIHDEALRDQALTALEERKLN